jgi:hypothetical protein
MIASNSWLAGALLLVCLVSPATALADPPAEPPTEEQVEAGRVAYREARELHRQGKLKEALERALEAYRIASTPVTALEAAGLLDETGRLVEARDIARNVAAFPVSPRESDKGREARQAASTLAAELDARIPKIAIAGRPAGVEVLLDGKPVPASAPTAWLGVDPGVHTLLVRAGERTCASISATLAEAEARTIDIHPVTWTCLSETAPATAGDTSAPQPPPAPPSPPPQAETPSPPAAAHTGRWAGVAIAAAGVVAVGVGGAFALSAKGSYDSVASQCNPMNYCDTSAYNTRNSARSQADVATVIMAAGGVATAGGIVLFLLDPRSRSSEVGRPVVGIGPGTVHVALRFP